MSEIFLYFYSPTQHSVLLCSQRNYPKNFSEHKKIPHSSFPFVEWGELFFPEIDLTSFHHLSNTLKYHFFYLSGLYLNFSYQNFIFCGYSNQTPLFVYCLDQQNENLLTQCTSSDVLFKNFPLSDPFKQEHITPLTQHILSSCLC